MAVTKQTRRPLPLPPARRPGGRPAAARKAPRTYAFDLKPVAPSGGSLKNMPADVFWAGVAPHLTFHDLSRVHAAFKGGNPATRTYLPERQRHRQAYDRIATAFLASRAAGVPRAFVLWHDNQPHDARELARRVEASFAAGRAATWPDGRTMSMDDLRAIELRSRSMRWRATGHLTKEGARARGYVALQLLAEGEAWADRVVQPVRASWKLGKLVALLAEFLRVPPARVRLRMHRYPAEPLPLDKTFAQLRLDDTADSALVYSIA